MIGNGAAVLAEAGGKFLLGEVELLQEVAVGQCALQRVQVSPVDVFDEGQLRLFCCIHLAEQGGKMGEPCKLGGAPTSFAGNQLVSIACLPDNDRLDQT